MPTKGPKPRPLADRFWAKVDKSGACWLWTGSTVPGGYGKINAGGSRGKTLRATRVSWWLAHGVTVPDDVFVCHSCDTPACVRPDHLFLGTTTENMHDAISKGRHAHGDRHRSRTRPDSVQRGSAAPGAKITEADVLTIRDLRRGGMTLRAIGHRFGLSEAAVCLIAQRKNWGHIP